VQLRPNDTHADLMLVDRKAWTATALAWLQPYLDAPLPASKSTVNAVETQFRATLNDDAEANRLLASLQRQTNVDQVVLPISQSDEYVYTRAGVQITDTSYGPGWQLGLYGISNG
jgi:peptide/nickel transport system substrate-binding protein